MLELLKDSDSALLKWRSFAFGCVQVRSAAYLLLRPLRKKEKAARNWEASISPKEGGFLPHKRPSKPARNWVASIPGLSRENSTPQAGIFQVALG